jgi:hypothetical protein
MGRLVIDGPVAAPMAKAENRGKLYRLFTFLGISLPGVRSVQWTRRTVMIGLALAMFIALFGWGDKYFGWFDPDGKVQLALFTSFILGAVAGYKSKG